MFSQLSSGAIYSHVKLHKFTAVLIKEMSAPNPTEKQIKETFSRVFRSYMNITKLT